MDSLKEEYAKDLLKSIPVVKGMNISIEELGEYSLRLKAPLDSNINYEGTAFGGSLNTTCILSCYLLIHHLMKVRSIEFKSLVIQDSQIRYLKPVSHDFYAQAVIEYKDAALLEKLLRKKGKGRINVCSSVRVGDSEEALVKFQGRFVASF